MKDKIVQMIKKVHLPKSSNDKKTPQDQKVQIIKEVNLPKSPNVQKVFVIKKVKRSKNQMKLIFK